MTTENYVPIVSLSRGSITESIHYGAYVVVDNDGNVIDSKGDFDIISYPRSSMKPLQAIPLLEASGDLEFNLSLKEIAILCASHSGTDEHVETIKSIHTKVGLKLENLQCGVHWPSDKDTEKAMLLSGKKPSAYHHNCSGKHSGMLAYAKFNNWELDNYLEITHPVQKQILQTVSELCDYEIPEDGIGVDGCSAPVFAIPLRKFAFAIANICDPSKLPETRKRACRIITQAMNEFPDMVAGPGKLDTLLMQSLKGKVIAKAGAEGYQMLGVFPDALYKGSPALGIAIKISDGDVSRRALNCFTVELLKEMGLITSQNIELLSNFGMQALKNWRGFDIGVISKI